MDETNLILMLKDMETGLLEKELGVYKINEHISMICGACAFSGSDGTDVLLKLTTERDVNDEEFSKAFDCYDGGVFDETEYVKEISEVDDCYNPEWEILLEFSEDDGVMEERLNKILELHKKELDKIFG